MIVASHIYSAIYYYFVTNPVSFLFNRNFNIPNAELELYVFHARTHLVTIRPESRLDPSHA